MKVFFFIFLVSLALIKTDDEEFPLENDVMVLTDATFAKALEKYEYLMVLFYAPWCGHCKKFKPEYEKAAPTLRKDGFYLAKVDATAEKELAKKFEIRGYPTTKFFIKGEAIDYTGGRTESGVIEWVKKKSQPPTKPLETVDDVEKFLKENPVCSIYFGTNKDDLKEFTLTALRVEDFPFATVGDNEVIKKYSKAGTVVLFKDFDEKKNEITTVKGKELKEFYEKYAVPRVMKWNEKAVDIVFSNNNPALMIFENEKSPKWAEYDKIMHNIYDKLSDKVKLILSETKESMAQRVGEYLGVKEQDFPIVMIVNPRGDLKKYKMTDPINENNLIKFVDDWKNNKLTKYLKSQEVPKDNNADVFVLVGNSFEKEVLKNDKDVMILFYAPWCGHCKAFHPIYEDIAKKLKEKNPKLLLAKMDATENEVENIDVHSFPTIKFYPGDKKYKSPIDYKGDRSFDDVIKFLKENVHTPLVYEEAKKEEKKDEGKKDEKTADL